MKQSTRMSTVVRGMPGVSNYGKLLEACAAGNVDDLQRLLDHDSFVETVLDSPIQKYNLIVERRLNLLELLIISAATGHCSVVEKLVSFGQRHGIAGPTLIDRDVVIAAIDGVSSVEVFTLFIELWAGVVEVDLGHLGNPLAYATTKDKLELVKVLLEEGADPNRRCLAHVGSGHYLRQSARSASLEMTKALLEHGAKIKYSGAIQEAARLGRLDVLELLSEYGADLDETLPVNVGFLIHDKRMQLASQTPLHITILHGQVDAARWLVEHGADCAIEDAQGKTPGMIAQESGNQRLEELFPRRIAGR